MKATYTLTWDEYAERFTNSWPRPDYFSAIVVAMVALPLLAYGLSLLAFQAMREEPIIDVLFIGGPAVLLFAGAFSFKFQAHKALKQAQKHRRDEYERWHAKEQSFSFDQEKWVHESQSGRHETPWAALLSAVEWPNVFHLVAEGNAVTVPKRSLDPASSDQLRSLAFPVTSEKWRYKVGAADFQAAGFALLWRRSWLLITFGNLFGLAMLSWVGQNWLSSKEKTGVVMGWVLASMAIILALSAQFWYLPLKYAVSWKDWSSLRALALSDRGLCMATVKNTLFIDWRTFKSFRETRRTFLIFVGKARYYILAKRNFSPEQQAEIVRLLRANVKPE